MYDLLEKCREKLNSTFSYIISIFGDGLKKRVIYHLRCITDFLEYINEPYPYGIDYKTVLKYWDMKPDGFAKARYQAKERAKKADMKIIKIIRHLLWNFLQLYMLATRNWMRDLQ
jgi:hypothetical protein